MGCVVVVAGSLTSPQALNRVREASKINLREIMRVSAVKEGVISQSLGAWMFLNYEFDSARIRRAAVGALYREFYIGKRGGAPNPEN